MTRNMIDVLKRTFELFHRSQLITTVAVLVAALGVSPCAYAQVRLGDICRVKGQEENTLHGFGLVVGLKGTGDGDKPATRALSQAMQLMGTSIPRTERGDFDLSELKNAKNVALVFITATVPPTGARQGSRIPCSVSAISAKSLAGGTLLVSPLMGPRPGDRRTYAIAQGPLTIEDPSVPTVAKVHLGCQLQEEFRYEFEQNGVVTLVIEDNHASFKMAQIVQYAINDFFLKPNLASEYRSAGEPPLAKAVDARNVVVRIPEDDRDHPVEFIAQLLSLPVEIREIPGTRVVISERSQVIVVGEEVAVRPVAIAHKNLTIEAGGQRINAFAEFNATPPTSDPSFALRSLVTALNTLKVDSGDMIEIIKALDREGALLGQLIIE